MYAALASLALASTALWSPAAACQYTEHPSSVANGNDALRVPLTSAGAGAQNECAATAQAFGLTTASIVPGEAGAGAECVLFGAQAGEGECGATYELETGALTLTNITACDTAEVQAIADAALPLSGAGQQAQVGQGTTAMKLANTAAVGKAVHSDVSFLTEEECLVACSTYVAGCTHATAVIAQGEMVKCSFHGSPTQGVQVQGASTYSNIVPNPQLASRTLGTLAPNATSANPVAAGVPATPGAAATPAAVTPVAAATAPAPATAVAPAPLPVAAVAPVVDESAPIGAAQPMGVIEELVYTAPGMCPGGLITNVPAAPHEDTLQPPDQVVDVYADVVNDEGKFELLYGEIVNGGAYCVAKGSTAPTVIVGGMFFWESGGECVAPPVNDAGESCCDVYMWQPNTAGLYYDNCSMKMAIQPNGLYHFETEMPGDESANGWGPDPEPHIHFDVICSGCAGDHSVVAGEYNYWNKFYPETLCTIDGCGTQGPEHQATELAAGGQVVYKYDFVLPADTRTGNQRKLMAADKGVDVNFNK